MISRGRVWRGAHAAWWVLCAVASFHLPDAPAVWVLVYAASIAGGAGMSGWACCEEARRGRDARENAEARLRSLDDRPSA